MGWRDRARPAEAPGAEQAPGGASGGGGWRSRATTAPVERSTATEAGAVSALSSASLFGAPAVLAFGDAITQRPKVLQTAGTSSDEGFLDRFRKLKDFYGAGAERVRQEHPTASTVGSLLPALIPAGGASSVAGLARQGAVYGGAGGLLGGDAKTLDGDVLGTLKDTAIGTGVGALARVAGGLVGKGVEKLGQLAGRRAGQLGDEVAEEAAKLVPEQAPRADPLPP